jgi:hypothetical protein
LPGNSKFIIRKENNMNKYIQNSLICLLFFTISCINISAVAMIPPEDIEDQIGTVAANNATINKKVQNITKILEKKIGMVDGEEGKLNQIR